MSAPRSRSLSDSVCPSAELLPVLPDRPDSALASTPITPVRNTSAPITPVRNTSAPVTPVPVSYACSGGRDTSPACHHNRTHADYLSTILSHEVFANTSRHRELDFDIVAGVPA